MWTQVILTSAGLVVAFGIIWAKALHPLIVAINDFEEGLPVFRESVASFRDYPDALQVLSKIAAEFRTDSGSSLRDAINRLEVAVAANTTTAALLEKKAEIQVRLDESDRRHMERLSQMLDRLDVKVDLAKGVAEGVAVDLAVAQGQVDAVADDLARRSERADAVAEGQPGEAADAGMRSESTEGDKP